LCIRCRFTTRSRATRRPADQTFLSNFIFQVIYFMHACMHQVPPHNNK
jgi:hypothetical protein